ncbi:MAG: nucleotidyltransferase domain-containing protein [Candidatus Woesearchaeota archaeon]
MNEDILRLFLEEPTMHFRFKDIKEKVKISDHHISNWLKKLIEQKIIIKHKKYYKSNYEHYNYKNIKKIYALNNLYKTGFLDSLCSLEAELIIIFGSYSKSDWHKESDIDIFILGNHRNLDKNKYEKIFRKNIQIFGFETVNEIKSINQGLLENIMKGILVKGSLKILITQWSTMLKKNIELVKN